MLLPGEKVQAGRVPWVSHGDTVQSQAAASPTLPREQRVTLEPAALAGHLPAVSRLPMYFPSEFPHDRTTL